MPSTIRLLALAGLLSASVAPAKGQIFWPHDGDNVACTREGWEDYHRAMVISDYAAMNAVVSDCPELPAPRLVSVADETIDFPAGRLDPFVYRRIMMGGVDWWVPEKALIGVPGDAEALRFAPGDQITFWEKVGLACPTLDGWQAVIAALEQSAAPDAVECFDGNGGEITSMVVVSEPQTVPGPADHDPAEFQLIEIEVSEVFRPGGRASVGDRYWINAFSAQRQGD